MRSAQHQSLDSPDSSMPLLDSEMEVVFHHDDHVIHAMQHVKILGPLSPCASCTSPQWFSGGVVKEEQDCLSIPVLRGASVKG